MNKKIVAIIQARMGSTRLPGKVLKIVQKKPMLWHVVNRAKHAQKVDEVIVATSTLKKDKQIVQFCQKNHIKYFCGSENDVLERFYMAASQTKANTIIRITADCPLIDPNVIDKTINFFQKGHYDYASAATGAGVAKEKINKFPDGLDCEVFTFKTLKKAFTQAKDPLEREHVTMYIWKRPKLFKLSRLLSNEDYSKLRFVVDHKEDLNFVRQIYKYLYPKNNFFVLTDIIALLKTKPKLLKINSFHFGKEGYEKLWETKKVTNTQLKKEFKQYKVSPTSLNKICQVVILGAEETDISGENKDRIDMGISLAKKIKKPSIIFLGTKKHNHNFKNYLLKKNFRPDLKIPTNRINTSTKTQIRDLANFLKDKKIDNLLIISHSYHLPRIKKYFNKYLPNIHIFLHGVGDIKSQEKEVESEIKKINLYSKKGDL